MASDPGLTGNVTSWGSSGQDCYHLIENGIAPYRFSLNPKGATKNSTVFSSSGITYESMTPGLLSVSGSISGRFAKSAAQLGNEGLVTFSSGGYVVGCHAWTLNLNWPTHPNLAFNATPPTWDEMVPGAPSWSATLACRIDTGTAAALPHAAGATLPSLTLKLTEEGATDNTFAGSAIIEDFSTTIQPNNMSLITYKVTGAGQLTVGGSSNVLPSGAVGLSDTGELVLQTATGQDLQGDAFLTSLTVSSQVSELIDVSANFQGTGEWS